jgi:hypothetical protein
VVLVQGNKHSFFSRIFTNHIYNTTHKIT